MNRWFEETIDIITMPRRGTGGYMPMVNPDDYIIWETIENYED